MKNKLYYLVVFNCLFIIPAINAQVTPNAAQNANTSLSNLTAPTTINASLIPDKDKTRNLGNTTKAWKNLYLDSAIYIGRNRVLFATYIKDDYGNLAFGSNTLNNNTSGTGNLAAGESALSENTTGYSNTAAGQGTLVFNKTGNNNTATGYAALNQNNSGSSNTAYGTFALSQNYSGALNTSIGNHTLYYNYTGSSNVAIGNQALLSNGIGNYNVAVGENALYNSGANYTTAVGTEAGFNNTSGNNNTYVGYHAGNTVTTGSSNTIIGYGADVSSGSLTNATAIGNYAVSGASNRVRIGNSSVTSIGGQVGWTNFSDERIKNNIKANVPGLAFINLLKPVTYHFDLNKEENISGIKRTDVYDDKYEVEKIQFTGFLAQQVEAAAKKINYDFSGVDAAKNDKDVYGLRYADFVVPLVKAVQELSRMNDAKDSAINSLQNQVNELRSLIISTQSAVNSKQLVVTSASLQQNIPNPFSNSTTINYFLPQQFSSAKIIITDKRGNALKQTNLSNNKGSVNVDAATLSAGAYQYSLYVDGKLIDTKQMILSK